MKITTRIGNLNDKRIVKCLDGTYMAEGIPGTFKTWLLAFEAAEDLRIRERNARDYRDLQNFHK